MAESEERRRTNNRAKGPNMKYRNYLLAFMTTFTLMAEAKEIYESKNKQGEVKFTDQPSPDAEVVNIQEPNIADAVDSKKSTRDKPKTKQKTKSVEPDVVYRGFSGDDDKDPKRVHREQQRQKRKYERQENNDGQGDKRRPKETRNSGQQKGQR